MLNKILSVIRYLFRRDRVEHDMNAELQYHYDRQTELNIRAGMTPQAAGMAARRLIGGLEQVKEECRDARLGSAIESTLQDIRYGVRVLLKNPGFTAMAIVTLALGIGVNTAVFSVVYGILLRPLPYQQGGRLVVLHQQANQLHVSDFPFSAKEIFDYRDQNHTLDAVVEHHTMTFLLLSKDSAERVDTAVVSANFFDVLGVRPQLGRTFVATDEAHGADAVLVLSDKYWRTRHGADPNIVGKVFQMNNRPHTVIGVLPPIPQYPVESDVYMPTSQCPTRSSAGFIANRQARMMTAFGRLKPGVPLAQAQADLSLIANHLELAYPDAYPKQAGYGIAAAPLSDDLTRRGRPTFLILLGAAGFVLLIACANVANLFLARLLRIEREMAVRAALGASRLRLMRQVLAESMLLAFSGAALGLALAPPAVQLLVAFAERFTTRASEIKIDAPVLLFTLLVSVGTALLFGLAPALASSRQASGALKVATGRTTSSRGRQRLRAVLVLMQVAVSFVLLIGAGLMLRSFWKLEQVNPGFRSDRLLTARFTLDFTHYHQTQQFQALWRSVLDRVKAIEGVQSVALATNFPFNPAGIAAGPGATEFQVEGKPLTHGEVGSLLDITVVSSGYFETIGQPVVHGRTFTGHDDQSSEKIVVVNQALARHRWPNANPIGRRVSLDQGKTWLKVAGVVADVREYGLDRPAGDEMYIPLLQDQFADHLVIRTSGDPMSVWPLIRGAIEQIDPQLAMDRVATIDHYREDSVASPKVTTLLLAIFAALALVVSASGIAAVMALAVSQRRNELGIRMALGAPRMSVLVMIVRQGLSLAAAGTILGMVGALALTRLLASLLYATSPTDAATFAGVSLLFLLVAAISSLLPARRGTAIDPCVALRQE
jgi:predicted permease